MRVVTKKSLADILSVSVRTIDYWVDKGVLPKPIHIGRRCYWQPEQLNSWLQARLSSPTRQQDHVGG